MTYFFYSLSGTIWLLNMVTFVIGSVWVLMVALNELLLSMGVDKWKNCGLNAVKPRKMKSGR